VRPLRVGIVGARRRRQGLGPFVARELAAAGARVPGIVGTTRESVEAARRELAERCGLSPRGFLSLDALLAAEALDALVVLTPHEAHARGLEAALAAGLHVLCEKPLVWGGADPAARAAELVAGFEERRLLLVENCQWPFTLEAYAELFPGSLATPPARFAMRLSPLARGARMLPDALPHALSLLQALAPAREAEVEGMRFSSRDPEAAEIQVGFDYVTRARRIAVELALVHQAEQPRDAWYALDGRMARRRIRPGDYALFLASDGAEVPLEDPLGALVRHFLRELERALAGQPRARYEEIAQRMRLLCRITAAFERGGPLA
jgi:predicted dehydrogenase